MTEHYELVLCGTCKHPAGQHLYGGGCRLDGCTCSGYIEGGTGRWSDDLTDRLGGFRIEIDDLAVNECDVGAKGFTADVTRSLDESAPDRRFGEVV